MKLSSIFKRAHQLAKTYIGHYSACFAMGLRNAWAEAKKMTMETFEIETYTNRYGKPKLSLIQLALVGSILTASYASSCYPSGRRNGKQNDVVLTAKGAAISVHYYNGRTELLGNSRRMLESATKVEGKSYEIKEVLKEFGFRWNGSEWAK